MCIVIRVCVDLHRGDFHPSSGLQILECLPKEVVDIANAALQLPTVNIIKGLAVGPRLLKIIDFESAIRRNPARSVRGDLHSSSGQHLPGRLNGTEIVSCVILSVIHHPWSRRSSYRSLLPRDARCQPALALLFMIGGITSPRLLGIVDRPDSRASSNV